MIKMAVGKAVFITALAVLGAVIAFALVLAAKIPAAAEGYRSCYEQSMRHWDFSFGACRVHTERLKGEFTP